MAIFAVSLQILRFFQKCFLSSPLRFIWILSKSLNLIDCHGNIKGKFSKNYLKIFSSKMIWGLKLKLCIDVHDISLYIKYVFYCRCLCSFVVMATLSFHRLIMGKVEIGIYFCVTADILTKNLQKCSWSSPSFLWMFSLLLKDLISDFYLTSLQLVLCRVAAVKRLPVHQP